MTHKLAASGLLLVALLSDIGSASGQSQGAAEEQLTATTGIDREAAVASVLAVDPRFADVADYDEIRRAATAAFRLEDYFTSGYYRVLGPTLGDFADIGFVALREPLGWLIEVNLVMDCAEVELDGAPMPFEDPCAWRHTWVYLVQPDGTVEPVFDAGDPDPLP